MKFLVDAHLPRRLVYRLRQAGYDVIHTLDLPHGNRSSDAEINDISKHEQRVVVTKDADFVDSFYVSGKPYKLLLVSTGNITNVALEALIMPNITAIATAFRTHDFIELTHTTLIIHT